MFKLFAPVVLIIAALYAAIRLDDTPETADITFVNQNEIFTLDPQRMSYMQDLRLAHVLYEGLVRWKTDDFSIVPAAAVAVPDASGDGRSYVFEIRPEAQWSNGDPITAHDFIYAWSRAITPDTAADYSNIFFVIEGAAAFFEWRSAQTARFVADPWSQRGDVEPDTVVQLVDRLELLLATDDLPTGIAQLSPGDRLNVEGELRRMREAAEEADSTLSVRIAGARATQRWVDRLREIDSRRAEAEWMWARAEKRFAETVMLRATGPRTLEVRLAQPTAYFLDLLCFGVFFPVHRPTVEGWPQRKFAAGWHDATPPPFADRDWLGLNPSTGKLDQKHEWAKPASHVGNGTHVLVQWRYKRDLLLEPSARYHDADRVVAGSIRAVTIEDTNTAVLAFQSGHVNWLADVSADYQADMLDERDRYVARYKDEIKAREDRGMSRDEALADLPEPEAGERRNIHKFPTFGTDFYSFNCRPELADGRPNPFALAAVRRAFVMSVDKHAIVARVTRLNEPVATTLIPPGSIEGYNSPKGLGYDPNEARNELKRAGWEDRDGDGFVEDAEGNRFPVIDLLYTTNVPRYKWISLDLKSQWERGLGVRVDPRPAETKFYREDLRQGNFMIARGRWYGDYGDPTTFLDLCRSTDGNNDRRYDNPEVDALLDRAAAISDPEERMRILEECEQIICDEDVPMLFLCQLVQVYMYEPGELTGLSHHPRMTQFLWQMKVER